VEKVTTGTNRGNKDEVGENQSSLQDSHKRSRKGVRGKKGLEEGPRR